jgi:putative transposase
VILDLCSRFAVGWAMSERITDDLTLDALGLALARRRPPQGLLHHSDRGSQGEFKRSSQHLTRGGCDDGTAAVFGAGRTSQTTLARPPLGAAA